MVDATAPTRRPKAGTVNLRTQIANARKNIADTGKCIIFSVNYLLYLQLLEVPKEDIASWRQEVEPGGDHLSDVSVPASKLGRELGAGSVHPRDSASCAPSPESSVVSSTNRKEPRGGGPPMSEVASSTAMSVQISPPTPRKKEKAQRTTTEVSAPSESLHSANKIGLKGGIRVIKRDESESLKVADSVDGRRSRSRSVSGSREGRSKYSNKDLPFNLSGDKSWRSVFCVTMFEYIGLQDDPWALSVELVEDVWQIVFPDLKYEIVSSGPVYYIVSPHLNLRLACAEFIALEDIAAFMRVARKVFATS